MQLLEQVPAVSGDGGRDVRPIGPSAIGGQGVPAPGEHVVDHDVVASAAVLDRVAGDAVDHVALHADAAHAIVEVDAVHAVALEVRRHVVDEVVAHYVAAVAPVPAGVDGASVARVLAHLEDLVLLDHVLVAPEQDRGVGGVVHHVVSNHVADVAQADGGAVGPFPLAELLEVGVFDHARAGLQAGAVTAAHADTAVAEAVEVGVIDAVIRARKDGAVRSGVSQGHAHERRVVAPVDSDEVGAPRLDRHVLERHPARFVEANQRVGQGRDHDVAPVEAAGGPEVEHARGAIEPPLPRFRDLFRDVVGVPGLSFGYAVAGGFREGDRAGGGVDARGGYVAVGPGVLPEAVEPQVGDVGPAGGAISCIAPRGVRERLDDGREAAVDGFGVVGGDLSHGAVRRVHRAERVRVPAPPGVCVVGVSRLLGREEPRCVGVALVVPRPTVQVVLQSIDQPVAGERRDAVLRACFQVGAGDLGGRGAEQGHGIGVLDVGGKVVGGSVWPACEGEPLSMDEQLDGGSVGLTAEASSLEDAVVGDAEGGEVELQDVVPCARVEACVHGRRGGDGGERGRGYLFAAGDAG